MDIQQDKIDLELIKSNYKNKFFGPGKDYSIFIKALDILDLMKNYGYKILSEDQKKFIDKFTFNEKISIGNALMFMIRDYLTNKSTYDEFCSLVNSYEINYPKQFKVNFDAIERLFTNYCIK